MQDIELLLEKENLAKAEIDYLVAKVKADYWPEVKNMAIPKHCGICRLFRFCSLISHELICPWLRQ